MAYNQHNFVGMPQGGTYIHSPDLSQFNDYQSASAGSSESFQTQVPLPYYHNSSDEEQRLRAPQQMPSPWATPDLSSTATMVPFQGSGKTLNPASSPYVPSGQLSQYPIAAQNPQGALQPATVYSREGSFSSSSSMVQPYQQGGQIGQIGPAVSYQNTHPFAPQPNMLGGPVGGGILQPHLPQAQQSAGPSYSQYASHFLQFQGYNSGQHMSNANSSVLFPPACPPPNTAQNITGIQYTPGDIHSGVSQPWVEHVTRPGMHNTQGIGQAGGTYTGYNPSIGFGSGSNMPYNLANQSSSHASTQESSSASITSKQSTVTRGETPKYHGQDTVKKAERRVSIHTPLASKAVRPGQTPSPATVVKASKSVLKIEQPHRLNIGDAEHRPVTSLTPGSRPYALSIESSSEPSKVDGVTIRSKRGHTFSSTESSQKKAVFDWIQKTPGLEVGPVRDSSDGKRRASPPKMMNLLAAGSGTASNLKTINENDPFVNRASDPSAEKSSTDPFASMQAIVPYNTNSQIGLVGQTSGMSLQLRNLTSNGTRKPSFAEAVDPKTLPFAEICRLAKDDKWGVVKIKNIPYSVNRPEVLAFLGRNAKVVAEYNNEPVHIIMERVTSKTLDCYVEFVNFDEAVAAVNRFETNRTGGRSGRLGHRHVEVELSSQEHLMKDLFPKAKNVRWNGSKPTILPPNPEDIFSSGFQGFVSHEEMVMLVKHVESPQRSPFSKDCPQRPFECLVSTLIKYPWYMVDFITIEQRNMLHKATIELLTLLVERVNNDKDDLCLTPMLLKRVWKAALKCPGFTPAMKDDIVYLCQLDPQTATEYGVPPYAPYWKYLWTIGPKPGAPADLLLWYIAIIRETGQQRQLSLAEQAALGSNMDDEKLFGNLDSQLNFPVHFRQMTLAEVARIEWSAVEMLLRQALG